MEHGRISRYMRSGINRKYTVFAVQANGKPALQRIAVVAFVRVPIFPKPGLLRRAIRDDELALLACLLVVSVFQDRQKWLYAP